MNNFSGISEDYIYQDFKGLEDIAFRDKITFYEQYRDKIVWLPFHKAFEIKLDYSKALFTVGKYSKYIEIANELVAESIDKNIVKFGGEEVFETCLFKMAASYFNIGQIDKCQHILKELIKIDPSKNEYRQFLFRAFHKENGQVNKITRATSIVFLFCGVIASAFQILVSAYFLPQIDDFVILMIKLFFTVGFLLLIVGELWHIMQCKRTVNSLTPKN